MARASGMPLIRSRLVTVKEADIGQGQGHGQQQGQQRYLGDPLDNGVAPQGYIFIEWMHPFAISLYAAWLESMCFRRGTAPFRAAVTTGIFHALKEEEKPFLISIYKPC